VIIAGAGPVGLFLACELRLGKLSVRVLEPLEDPHSPLKRLPFGMRGLWGPSIEAFYRRGLLQQIASQPRADDGALASRDLDQWRPEHSSADRPATSRASSSTTATRAAARWFASRENHVS
jgi:2-polyprenyl-6-methoxyphenol hydroxylase-like FAD-dependent oxidoreductase